MVRGLPVAINYPGLANLKGSSAKTTKAFCLLSHSIKTINTFEANTSGICLKAVAYITSETNVANNALCSTKVQ